MLDKNKKSRRFPLPRRKRRPDFSEKFYCLGKAEFRCRRYRTREMINGVLSTASESHAAKSADRQERQACRLGDAVDRGNNSICRKVCFPFCESLGGGIISLPNQEVC